MGESFFVVVIAVAFTLVKMAANGSLDDFRDFINGPLRNFVNRHLIFRTINPVYKKILEDYFEYYQKLTPKNKILFEKRVQKFIDVKSFVPCGDLKEIRPEMKTLVAASAIQITFGLPGVYFEHFKKIYLYPNFYFSEGMQQYNEGEVHKKKGIIVLSWKDFLEGYSNNSDARNVGLHEMAHALRLENMIENEEYGYLNWDDIQILNEITVEESEKIRSGHQTIFSYNASVHYQEFFAVLIEIFFERSEDLLEYHPRLFHITCRLLQQNPMTPNDRFKSHY